MEIPYVVTPRKDTGLFNAKIAIWLFLASEVMLFGGLFSAYIFLRVGADYPWPERALPVLPGLINTFVLIASSVTVVFAWASLKLRKWFQFQVFMFITIACAALFMVLKGIEYNTKFHHQAVRLADYSIVEGHLGYEKEADGKELLDHNGQKIEANRIIVETEGLAFNTRRFHKPWVEEIMSQAKHHGAKIVLAADIKDGNVNKPGTLAKAGEELSVALLEKIQKAHLKAAGNNSSLRIVNLREQWDKAHAANPDKKGWQLAPDVNIDEAAIKPDMMVTNDSIAFKVEPPVHLSFRPQDIKEGPDSSSLRDSTLVSGKMLASPMEFHYVDALDFRQLAAKAIAKGEDPVKAIDNCWLVQNHEFAKKAWEWNKAQTAKLEKELIEKHKIDKKTGRPNREPTPTDRFRLGWKEFAAMADGVDRGEAKATIVEEFKGPDYHHREEKHTFPHLEIPRERVAFASKFTPKWNTYYAIYFTITGLHGLHVIGGALVLAYYLFFGRKMYESNPEWLANRVEVGGLFWHFVDLVWIFVFPIFYLM